MKVIKFKPNLCEMILSGSKTSTWRLFDDKNLQVGDSILCRKKETRKDIALAKIVSCIEKRLEGVTDQDYDGHEKYESISSTIEHFKEYYGDKVDVNSPLKIIQFELLEKYKPS